MTVVVLAGLGFGLALIGLWRALRPVKGSAHGVVRAMELASQSTRVAGLSRPRPGAPSSPAVVPGERRFTVFRAHYVAGERMAEEVEKRFGDGGPRGLVSEITGWLKVTRSSLPDLCAEIVLATFAGVSIPIVFALLAVAGRVHLPGTAVILAAPVLGAAMGLLPVWVLRSKAEHARKDARAVLASFLDLVVLGLAGGMGIESALHSAAGVSDDPMSLQLRGSLEVARDSGDTPWRALAALGSDLGIDELTELAAAVGLAGREGARVRATLAAKAGSIRRHQLAEAEGEANTLTERLFFPGAFLLVGFLLFLGYPAVARILGGF